MKLGKTLLDTTSDPSLTITENEGKLMLNISVGIKAAKVPQIDNPSVDIQTNFRDAFTNRILSSELG
jgi:hypothetical protein